ncbi:MAG: helix-turn-helix domain-containing protein, partial [Smithellaceae bacterium]|nr:helix-turn-helix domain-containing protein [Smithellaceae bacterium]
IGEVLEVVKKICSIDDKALCSRRRNGSIAEARTIAAWAVMEFSDGTISEVGRFFGRDVSTLSACIRRLTDKAENDFGLADRMDMVKQGLMVKATKQA